MIGRREGGRGREVERENEHMDIKETVVRS